MPGDGARCDHGTPILSLGTALPVIGKGPEPLQGAGDTGARDGDPAWVSVVPEAVPAC